ncbi:endonuclease/exonuclease/phosphatase family protein [Patescibacteria group bacterium]|nr:endonuclease/exonuclease/phosphatase family protein [Patescibacteria group bacterium]
MLSLPKKLASLFLALVLLLFFSKSQVWAADPHGWFGVVGCDSVSGWTCDLDVPEKSIDFHVYSDGQFLTGGRAGIYREDAVKEACGGISNYHGLSFDIPDSLKDGRVHQLEIFGLNEGPGENANLNNYYQVGIVGPCLLEKQVFELNSIKMMSFNIAQATEVFGSNTITNSQLADYIKQQQPDIVGIQDFAGDINNLKSKLPTFQYTHMVDSRGWDLDGVLTMQVWSVILSKFPLTDCSSFKLYGDYWKDNNAHACLLKFDSLDEIRIVHYHSPAGYDQSFLSLLKLVDQLKKYNEESIFILGDFNQSANVPLTNSEYINTKREFLRSYRDAYWSSITKIGGDKGTTIEENDYKPDHIFYKYQNTENFWMAMKTEIDYNQVQSDHYPVITDFSYVEIVPIIPTPTSIPEPSLREFLSKYLTNDVLMDFDANDKVNGLDFGWARN